MLASGSGTRTAVGQGTSDVNLETVLPVRRSICTCGLCTPRTPACAWTPGRDTRVRHTMPLTPMPTVRPTMPLTAPDVRSDPHLIPMTPVDGRPLSGRYPQTPVPTVRISGSVTLTHSQSHHGIYGKGGGKGKRWCSVQCDRGYNVESHTSSDEFTDNTGGITDCQYSMVALIG